MMTIDEIKKANDIYHSLLDFEETMELAHPEASGLHHALQRIIQDFYAICYVRRDKDDS